MAPAPRLLSAREASPAGPGKNLARTAGQAVLFWAFFFAFVPALLIRLEEALGMGRYRTPLCASLGVVLFILAAAVNLWTAWMLAVEGEGTPLPLAAARRLVVRGPYRWVRNPMALSALLQGAGVGLWLGSPAVLAYVLAGGVMWQVFVRPWEEADLERRFGESYRDYRREVRCWVPRSEPYRAASPRPSGTPFHR